MSVIHILWRCRNCNGQDRHMHSSTYSYQLTEPWLSPGSPSTWACSLLAVLFSPPHGPALVHGRTSSLQAPISVVLAPRFQPHRRAGTWCFCTRAQEMGSTHQKQSLKGRQERLCWLDTRTQQDSNSTSPIFPVLPLFSCACFSPVLLPPLLSPPLFLSLNIPSKMIFPNRESCSCRQFLPIFPWTESLPWTHLEGSHPAHGVAAPSDNQEGPGQENPLVPVDFMEFTSHSYHKPPCSFCKPFYLFIYFLITEPNKLLSRPSRG